MYEPARPTIEPKRSRPNAPKHSGVYKQKIALWLALAALGLLALFVVTLPDVHQVTTAAPGNSVQIFDKDDKLVVTVDGDEEREFAPLSSIPKVVPQALMSAEDHTFYKHNGLSMKGIMRAFVVNAGAGKVVEGGSTLTQQLAKNLFFENTDRSFIRKLREAVLALQIEKAYTKDQILEMYLNQVYFGRSAFGIERAAKRYFGKSSHALTLAEAAFLTGLVKAPSYLGDPDHLKDAIERQHLVLGQMQELGYITPAQSQTAMKARLSFTRTTGRLTKFPYYMSAVQQFLQENFDRKRLDEGGLRVYTNLDPVAQRLAERTVAQRVRAAGGGMNQCALVSVLVEDGSVVALVGGAGDYWKHQWNSAINPHTMGSSFKPFVYLTGFMQGKITPDTMVEDAPVVVPQRGMPDWVPKNFDNDYYGNITIREAIALSRNVCAVRVALATGIGNIIETAKTAGIKSDLIPTPALALGASAASPIEMAGAYSTFARGGTYIPPQLVRRVVGRDGFSKDFKFYGRKVFPDSPVRELVSCMESVVKEGTGVAARLSDRPVAGKTGTTDEARDLWFVGFTPHMVTAVWGGNDQHRSLGSLTGGAVLTGTWKAYNQAYYRVHKVPAGTFYTEQAQPKSENIFDQLLRNPDEVPKEEQQPQAQSEQQPQQEGQPAAERPPGLQDENAEQREPQAQRDDAQQFPTEDRPFMIPLPGMPQPGHVRQPAQPAEQVEPTEPSGPRRYEMPAEEGVREYPEPAPAPERVQPAPSPAPAPGPGARNDYGQLLRTPQADHAEQGEQD